MTTRFLLPPLVVNGMTAAYILVFMLLFTSGLLLVALSLACIAAVCVKLTNYCTLRNQHTHTHTHTEWEQETETKRV